MAAEGRMTVLLVEDDADHAELIRRRLASVRDRPITMEWVQRLEDGLRRLQTAGVDAVLLDLGLPDSQATDTLPRLLARYPTVAVVVLTATDDLELATASVQQGAQDCLVKSQISGELVVRSLRYAVERKSSELRLKALNETLEQRVAQRTAEADKRAGQLRWLANQLTLAEERERRRLSELLHDHLQQLLVAAQMMVDEARRAAAGEAGEPGAAVGAALGRTQSLLKEAIQASRSLSVELSPPVLYEGGLAAALRWFGQQAREKYGLHLQLELDERSEPDSEEARVLLFQAVRELVFNVIKYAHVEQARVSMAAPDAQHLEITVADEGTGFEAGQVPQVGEGSGGFGLFSIRERLELLGGQMHVRSRPGHGTRVTLRVPRRRPRRRRDEPERRRGETPSAVQRGSAPLRVVIAEDRAVLRTTLRKLLERQPDLRVVGEAGDGQQAVELVMAERPHVVLMDLSMPRLDGVEATRRILGQLPEAQVIGLTMHDDPDSAQRLREAGAVALLSKDAPIAEIVAAIRRLASPAAAGQQAVAAAPGGYPPSPHGPLEGRDTQG